MKKILISLFSSLLLNLPSSASLRIYPEKDETFLEIAKRFPACGQVVRTDDAWKTAGGKKLTPDQVSHSGSGTLIEVPDCPTLFKNRIVITAAHVLYNGKKAEPYKHTFFKLEGHSAIKGTPLLHPDFEEKSPKHDIALLILEVPLNDVAPQKVDWARKQKTLKGKTITSAGYGMVHRFFQMERASKNSFQRFKIRDTHKRGSTSVVMKNQFKNQKNIITSSPFRKGSVRSIDDLAACDPTMGLLSHGDSGGLCVLEDKMIGVNSHYSKRSKITLHRPPYEKFYSIDFYKLHAAEVNLLGYPEQARLLEDLEYELCPEEDEIIKYFLKNDFFSIKNIYVFLPFYQEWIAQAIQHFSPE